jgi:hypothetical protein
MKSLNKQPIALLYILDKAEGGNKMLPANQEQADRRSAVVACIDLQAG